MNHARCADISGLAGMWVAELRGIEMRRFGRIVRCVGMNGGDCCIRNIRGGVILRGDLREVTAVFLMWLLGRKGGPVSG